MIQIPLTDLLGMHNLLGCCITEAQALLEARDKDEMKAGVELICQHLEHVLEQTATCIVNQTKEGNE